LVASCDRAPLGCFGNGGLLKIDLEGIAQNRQR
jgi:hypothetical protein